MNCPSCRHAVPPSGCRFFRNRYLCRRFRKANPLAEKSWAVRELVAKIILTNALQDFFEIIGNPSKKHSGMYEHLLEKIDRKWRA